MLIIGLTGGIGSGKSTVSEYLSKNMGLTIIDADQIARDVTRPGQETLLKLREAFGSEIINDDGTLDRRKLAGIAFQSDEKKKLLEKITHSAIREEINCRLRTSAAKHENAVVLDVPLLMESGIDGLCDTVWVVTTAKDVRIERISARDGITKEEINARINAQISDRERFARADEIIDNSGDKEALYREIERLIKKYV
ncbi:MAG: dephospho-CoA kinase [Eubacteriales Family XIII. Incertae Sedis bacterium]|nr:MAG: dephospho-CoA kinase [Clostridiales Family XIII bacterium]